MSADREFGCALLSAVCAHLKTCHGCIIYYFCKGKDPRESVSQILELSELSVQVAGFGGKNPKNVYAPLVCQRLRMYV